MERRTFLKLIAASSASTALPTLASVQHDKSKLHHESKLEDYLKKIRHPNEFHEGDITSDLNRQHLVSTLAKRLGRVKRTVGHGNFSVVSFDQMLRFGRDYSKIGKFSKKEIEFLDELFHEDATHYGFYGEKPIDNLTGVIKSRDIEKIPHTGQFLFKGEPLALYTKIKKDLGDPLILTSGVRNVVKQMHLFLNKAARYDGNLSLASRSLAPPGYSFHGISDFDVGNISLAAANFTDAFARTDEYKKLIDLGYISIRYPADNHLGVRFEPWHIQVT